MKNLKLKSIFSVFAVVGLVSFLLTSCTKEPSLDIDKSVNQLESKSLEIFLPIEVASKSQDEIYDFLSKSTYSEILKYKNDAVIFEFLQNKNLFDIVISENVEIKSLSEIKLDKYLSNEQNIELNKKLTSFSELENRYPCLKTRYYDTCIMVPTDMCKKEVRFFPDVWYPCNWKKKCITQAESYWDWCD